MTMRSESGVPAGAIICPRCGWHNDATARMCGGCGQPLPLAPAPGTSYGTTVALPGAPLYTAPADDTPTVLAPGRLVPPPDMPPHPAYRPGVAPAWPGTGAHAASPHTVRAAPAASRARPRRGNCLTRAVVTLLVAALVLACVGVGLWTLVIRPPLHAAVDGGIRTAVGTVVDEANSALARLPAGSGATAQIPIPAALIDGQLQRHLPANVPLRNVTLDFASGGVVVDYTLAGRSGYLYDGLAAQGGRLMAHDATVTGPLALVESSSELQQAVQDELAGLTTSVAVTSVSAADHTLLVTVKATGG